MYSFIPDESPREPGVFLVPAGCTPLCPPSFDNTKFIPRITEKGWVLEPLKKKSWIKRLIERFK